MPKKFKGENTKVAAANDKKAAAADAKAQKQAAEKAKVEDAEWSKGAKADKKAAEAAKKEEAAKRKAEAAKLLAEEEAALPSKPQIRPAKGAEKTALKREQKVAQASKESAPVETLSARNIDDALDLLSLVDGSDAPTKGGAPSSVVAAATGGASGMLDRHPERRFKAALAAYEERELPIVRKENPGLRLQQAKQLVFKEFQKSPENPFNQTQVAYDTSKDDLKSVAAQRKAELEARLRE